jgi:hypothetical protein
MASKGAPPEHIDDYLAQNGMTRDAFKYRMQGGDQYKIGEAGMQDAAAQVGAEMNPVQKVAAGIGAGAQRVAHGLGGLVGLVDPEEGRQAREVASGVVEGAGPLAKAGQIGTEVAIGAAAPGRLGLSSTARGVLPAISRVAEPMLVGAGTSAAMAPDGERGRAAAFGAGGAALGSAASRALRNPVIPTEAARRMMDEGIQPSVGQTAGGVINRTEEALQGMPVVGGAIRGARDRAVGEYRDQMLNDLSPGLGKGTGIEEALVKGRGMVEQAYEDAAQKMAPVSAGQFPARAMAVVQDPSILIEPGKRAALQKWTQWLSNEANAGPINGARWKEIDAKINKQIGNAGQDAALGGMLREIQKEWRTLGGAAFKQPDQMYRKLVTLENAAGGQRALNVGGEFTPAEASKALAKQTGGKAANIAAGARVGQQSGPLPGNVQVTMQPVDVLAKQRQLTADALDVLQNKLSDSGTTERYLANRLGMTLGAGAAGAAGGAVGSSIGAMTPGAIALPVLLAGGGLAATTRPGARVLTGNTPLQAAVRRFTNDDRAGLGGKAGRILADALTRELHDSQAAMYGR